ncbi:MAG: zinc-dependent alcohol dehydrogenase family protein [Actinomycetota bacterium]
MRAMVLDEPGRPLRGAELPEPVPGPGQVRVRVRACAICRTDLHVLDGDLPDPTLPLVLGHQIVGRVDRVGEGVDTARIGQRAGVPWLGWTDGTCRYCADGRENLCPNARFTGYQIDGGFAELAVADARFCLPIPAGLGDLAAAPLLCAGLIGSRSLAMTGDARTLGLYGFGNAARIVAQVALAQGRSLFAFTRPGDTTAEREALELGCAWAGDSTRPSPEPLDAAIVFAAVGDLVPLALAAVAPGGVVVCAEIHMTDIPSFPYSLLWGERHLRSVANLTRRDGLEFLPRAAELGISTRTASFPLEAANEAVAAARTGEAGTSVLVLEE